MELRYDMTKIKIVDIGEVRANEYNPKDENTAEFRRVKRSVELNGLRLPIVVRENNGYEIIDGEQRWRACKELGYAKVLIYNEGVVSDNEAKALTIAYQQQVPFNEVELAYLLKDLAIDQDIKLPYSDEELSSYLKMADFDWSQLTPQKEQDTTVVPEEIWEIKVKVNEEQYKAIQEVIRFVMASQSCDGAKALAYICELYLRDRASERELDKQIEQEQVNSQVQ